MLTEEKLREANDLMQKLSTILVSGKKKVKKETNKKHTEMEKDHYNIPEAMILLNTSYWKLLQALRSHRIDGIQSSTSRATWWIPKMEVERIKREKQEI